jgi:hypothetical protein
MRRYLLALSAIILISTLQSANAAPPADWRAKVAESLPLFGHRNWILIVDSAYPEQSSLGIETVETNAPQLEVVR